MRITAGSVHASRKARTPATISSHGSSMPPIVGADVGHEALLQLLVDGPEEVALVGEVVIEGAARDTRPGHDLLGADRREAALREQLAAGAQEGDASRVAARPGCLRVSRHTTCMLCSIQPVWKEHP